MNFEALDPGALPALLLSALLRLVGAELMDCEQFAQDWPAEMAEAEVAEARQLRACGVVHSGGALWLRPSAWRKLRFDDAGLVGLVVAPTVSLPGLPGGTSPGAYWVHRSGAVRRTHLYDNGPDYFEGGLARYIDARGKFGFVDRRLRVAIPAAFDFAFPFDGGRADVCSGCARQACRATDCEHGARVDGGTWGSVDRRGQVRWRPAPGPAASR